MSDMQGDQTSLLDLDSKEFNIMFVEESQPLKVFRNPLHWKAHKLQVALARLDRIAERNPAQFNSTVYMQTLDKLGDIMEEINKQGGSTDDQVLGQGDMAGERNAGAAPSDGEVKLISMDS